MADKEFIGKVSEKVFSDGGVIVKVGFNQDDIAKLKEKANGGWVNLNFRKSKGGKWYGEFDAYVPRTDAVPAKNDDNLPF